MVCTWRYPSFKDVHLTRARSPVTFVLFAVVIYLIWNYSQPTIFAVTVAYVLSGIVIRVGGIVRRRLKVRTASCSATSACHCRAMPSCW